MADEVADQPEGGIARWVAAGAVAVAAFGVLLVLLTGGGDSYQVKAEFQSAGQIVKGNVVQSAGRKVGTVESVELTDDGQAELLLDLDETVAPLREGTTATR